MRSVFKSKGWLAALVCAALVGAYAGFGFGIAPGLIRQQAVAFVSQTYGRELQIGRVRLNPFLLQLEVSDVVLPDQDGQAMLGLKRLFVDVEVASLWRRELVLREVSLDAPGVHAVVRADGSLNLADLAPPARAEPAREKSALPRVWIASLSVSGGNFEFVDTRRKPRPLVRSLAPVAFALKDFRTTSEGGDFVFSASSPRAERIDWKGRLALAPTFSSQGDFSVAGLRAPEVAEWLGDVLPFGISGGAADLAGSYRVVLGRSLDLQLQLPKLTLTGLALRARGAEADWVQLPSLTVTDTVVALPERRVSVGQVALAGLKVTAWLNADGSVNLQRLLATATPTVPAAAGRPPAAAGKAAVAPAAAPWSVQLASLDLTDAAIDFEDRRQAPVQRFAVSPLHLRVAGASLDLSRPWTLAVDAKLNGRALFKVDGSLTPQPLAADLDLSLQQASLQILQPYILPFADLTIQDGLLAVVGKLRAAPPKAQGPMFSFTGDVKVSDFKSVDNALKQDLVNFRGLELQKLRYAHAPDALSIDRILVTQPYARVSIGREKVLNISAVLDPKGVAAQRAPAGAPAGTQTAKPTPRKAGVPAQRGPAAEKLPIRIRELRVAGGRMSFSDASVQPNFAAEVFALDGAVSGLSSAPSARATVDLKGRVDEFSPVAISGSIQPFAYDRYTDIGLKFQNISLPVFNPYSGQFAGYTIAKGKLDTTLHYLVQDRRLAATHKVRIDQLEWGEATASQGAATLPVKFATSLLKDKDGVIDLDIPVSGTLDDPQLRIWPIVWKVITNLVVKVVSAPFTLIASLFSGAQEAQFVDFAPGEAALDAASAERLAALAGALVDKAELRLDVPIGSVAELDRPALAERRYAQQLNAATAAALGRKPDDPTPLPPFDSLPPQQRLAVLGALVRQQGGVVAPLPVPSAASGAAGAEAAAIAALEKQARAAIAVPEAELGGLAQQRAVVVQRALLTGTALNPERVFLTAAGNVSAQGEKVRFELALK